VKKLEDKMTNETMTREPIVRLRDNLNEEQIAALRTAIGRLNSRGREVLLNMDRALRTLEPGETIILKRIDWVAFEARQQALLKRNEARSAARRAEREEAAAKKKEAAA
jgi:hypothetical protein